jgi:hypothetical protein
LHKVTLAGLAAVTVMLGTVASAATALPAGAAQISSASVPSAAARAAVISQLHLGHGGLAGTLRAGSVKAGTATAAVTPGDELISVSCVSTTNCLAVGVNQNGDGGNGTPLTEKWNGSKWTSTAALKLPAGGKGGALVSVACKSATECVGVGAYIKTGTATFPLAAKWNGKAWTSITAPGTAGDNTSLQTLSCVTATDCIATGSFTTDGGNGAAPLADSWNGSKWTQLANPKTPSGSQLGVLTSVACVAAKSCMATGLDLNSTTGGELAETWNGSAWTMTKAPATGDTTIDELIGVSCLSLANCSAVGESISASSPTVIKETGFAQHWNGTAWSNVTVPWAASAGDTLLSGVSCVSPTDCVAVGMSNINENSEANDAGRAASAVYNGKTWTVESVPAPAKDKDSLFNGVMCRSTTYCAAVGMTGPANSDNGNSESGFWNGKTWKLVGAI